MNELTERPEPKIHEPACKIAGEIAEERSRQIEGEGFSTVRDDQYVGGDLAKAAACYAISDRMPLPAYGGFIGRLWPWPTHWWKPTNRRRDLIKAGALIVAEIERIDRAAEREKAAG